MLKNIILMFLVGCLFYTCIMLIGERHDHNKTMAILRETVELYSEEWLKTPVTEKDRKRFIRGK